MRLRLWSKTTYSEEERLLPCNAVLNEEEPGKNKFKSWRRGLYTLQHSPNHFTSLRPTLRHKAQSHKMASFLCPFLHFFGHFSSFSQFLLASYFRPSAQVMMGVHLDYCGRCGESPLHLYTPQFVPSENIQILHIEEFVSWYSFAVHVCCSLVKQL